MSNDRVYLGRRMIDYTSAPSFLPFSRVTLWADDNHCYTAGDDTGRTMEADCPWATQEMCDAVLTKIKGYQYIPYTATDAMLDPAAELGDGVAVNGRYSVIAAMDTHFDAMCACDIAAPSDEELDHEYPYKSAGSRAFDHKLAQAKAEIKVTTDKIILNIKGVDGRVSSISQNLDEIKLEIQDSNGNISSLQQTVGSLSSRISNAEGAASSAEQKVDSIELSVSNNETSSTIKLMVDGVAVSSKTIKFTGNVVFESDLADGNTVIDGACIQTGQISADYIKLGGAMEVYRTTSSNACGGYIGYMTGMSASGAATAGIGIADDTESAVVICTNAGARMGYDGNGTVVCTSGKVTLTANSIVANGTLKDSSGAVITSDRNAKKDIGYKKFADYIKIFDLLKPAVYRLKGGTRRHLGFIAQDVEDAVKASGISTDDFAALCIDEEDGSYGLRYNEFIPLLTAKIQQQDQVIQALLNRVAALEEVVKNG